MPWLADLVQSSENNLNSLPVQCLCEFLLMNHSHNNTLHNRHKSIKPKVASRLQELLMGVEATPQSSTDLIKYFIERWSSPEMSKREASIDGFQSIILLQRKYRESITAEDELDDEGMKTIRRSMKMHIVKDESFSWLHEKFPNIPYFEESLKSVLDSLLKVTISLCILYYIVFDLFVGSREEIILSNNLVVIAATLNSFKIFPTLSKYKERKKPPVPWKITVLREKVS